MTETEPLFKEPELIEQEQVELFDEKAKKKYSKLYQTIRLLIFTITVISNLMIIVSLFISFNWYVLIFLSNTYFLLKYYKTVGGGNNI